MRREQQTVSPLNQRQERLVIEYTEALINGDLDMQDRLMAVAIREPELERAFWEITEGYGAELIAESQLETEQSLERDTHNVTLLVESHFAGYVLNRPEDARAFQNQEELQWEPLTVGIVAATLRSDLIRGNVPSPSTPEREETLIALKHLESIQEPLPDRLTVRNVRGLLTRLITRTQTIQNTAQHWLETQFHEAAAHLLVGQTETRLAAARRVRNNQKRASQKNDDELRDE